MKQKQKTRETKKYIYRKTNNAPDENNGRVCLLGKQGGCGSVVVEVRLHLVYVEGL